MKNSTPNIVSRIELPVIGNEDRSRGTPLGERLDLVEHVSIKLDIQVGQATMPISKLFTLAPGEVLALDAQADAPVEVLLNGRRIGRGELLAVGDKFGIRITELSAEG